LQIDFSNTALKAGIGLIRGNKFSYTENGSWLTLEAWLILKKLTSNSEQLNFIKLDYSYR